MTKLISEIAESLTQTRIQAQMFRRAAYYDSQAAHVPFNAIKEGGTRNIVGANPDEFKRIIAGEEGSAEGPIATGIASQETEHGDKSAATSSKKKTGFSEYDEG